MSPPDAKTGAGEVPSVEIRLRDEVRALAAARGLTAEDSVRAWLENGFDDVPYVVLTLDIAVAHWLYEAVRVPGPQEVEARITSRNKE